MMKSRHVLLAFFLILTFAAEPYASAQWAQTNGPFGGNIKALAVSGSTLFAGSSSGSAAGGNVYRSTDNGASWSEADLGISHNNVSALAMSGSNLIAATDGGVFLSTDNGTSWARGDSTMTTITTFAVNGTNLLALAGGTVHLSTNYGATWASANTGMTNFRVQTIAASGSTLFAGTNGGGVFRSTDNGTSWTTASIGLGQLNVNIYLFGVSAPDLFAITDQGIFLSTDNAANWIAVNSGLPPNAYFTAIAANGPNVFGGFYYGSGYFSTDNGTNWTAAGSGLPANSTVQTLATIGTNLFAGTMDGVFRSTDNGKNWTMTSKGLTMLEISALAVLGSNTSSQILFAGTNGSGVFRSSDNGTSWSAVNSGFQSSVGPIEITALAAVGTAIVAGTSKLGMFLSTDSGASWTLTTQADVVYLLATSGTNLYAMMGEGVTLSTNNGASWTIVGSDIPSPLCLAASSTNLFAGTAGNIGYGGVVYSSTDSGAYWTYAVIGLTGFSLNVQALAVSGTNLFAGTWGNKNSTGSGVFLSTDNGTTWNATSLMNFQVDALAMIGTNLFAGSEGSGTVFLSTNNGTNWKDVSTGLSNTITNQCFAACGTDILVGTLRRGVWRRPLSEMNGSGAVTQNPQIPERGTQVYPNPFPNKTTITISPHENGATTITIVNLLGQEIARLFDGDLTAGPHAFTWDASSVAPGRYWCISRMGGSAERIALSVQR